MKLLENKTAVITGGSKGIGFATAQLFIDQGAKVIIMSRSIKSLQIAKNSIIGDLICIQGDVTNLADLEMLFQESQKYCNGIDIIFANAGMAKTTTIEQLSEQDFDQMINVNYKGVFFTITKGLSYLNDGASIILNASVAGGIGFTNNSLYSSTKAAVIQLARSFAADLAYRKIRVNAISPGYIKTSIWDPLVNSSVLQIFEEKIPLEHRFGSTDEVAQTVLFLASQASSYITGQNIIVDGGLSAIF
ncbi:MAG: gdhIV 2 [Gammaproteobacteria bacterium]|jgi:NAD(P)-dependent dehydrogenase (short-subunit alcohol dehydrogenase family)|nr:gdhIV 2 [Gammaproteobacteria bacterium]